MLWVGGMFGSFPVYTVYQNTQNPPHSISGIEAACYHTPVAPLFQDSAPMLPRQDSLVHSALLCYQARLSVAPDRHLSVRVYTHCGERGDRRHGRRSCIACFGSSPCPRLQHWA